MSSKAVNAGFAKLKIFLLLGLWAAAFIPVYPGLFDMWFNHPNNSHGFLVPIISAFLIWRKRKELREIEISNSTLGLFILVTSMALYILAYAGSVAVVSRSMIVFSLIGLLLFVFGKEVIAKLMFPLLFLLFMIPVPDSVYSLVALPLQLFATKISTGLIQVLGIAAYREGNMVYFAKTQLEVAEACSGLRSMMAFIMLAFLFTYLMSQGRHWKKGLVIFSAIPLAIIANIIRVAGTGILANFYGEKVAKGFLHEFSGLAVFVLGFVLLFLEYFILERSKRTSDTNIASPAKE